MTIELEAWLADAETNCKADAEIRQLRERITDARDYMECRAADNRDFAELARTALPLALKMIRASLECDKAAIADLRESLPKIKRLVFWSATHAMQAVLDACCKESQKALDGQSDTSF